MPTSGRTGQPVDGNGEELPDPEQARRNPEEAVDALERRVLGGPEHRLDGGYPDDVGPEDHADRQASPDSEMSEDPE